MRTIMILTNHDGGLFHFRRELLERLLAEGFRVIVSVPAGEYRTQIEALGCVYEPTEIERRGMNPVKDFLLFCRYGRLIKKYDPSVILTFTIKPNIYGALQARIGKVPYIVNVTGLGTALQRDGVIQKLLLFLYRCALKKACCGVNLQEFQALPYPEETQEIRILNITRIMKDKGIEELLSASEAVHKRYPGTVFEIVGDFEEDSRTLYEEKVEELQKNGIIKYYGYQKDIKAFLARCHLVVHPTYHEGMSNVLLEAAASARPVAASDISGCREAFEDGKGGLAFKPQDAGALTQAVEHFLQLEHTRKRQMGEAARSYVEQHFDRDKVVQAYMEEIRMAEK